MVRGLPKFLKPLIITNLYIATAAVCFQLIIVVLVNGLRDWNWMLTLHTFTSTWFIYQFSRWNFHKDVKEGQVEDEIYSFLDRFPGFTVASMAISGLVAVATLTQIQLNTIYLLVGLGLVSVIYPIQLRLGGKTFSLRSIPFAKIFLIAIVWAGISTWVPLSELNYPIFEHWDRFLFHCAFIVFITLPFDMVDIQVDEVTGVRTIPQLLGLRNMKLVITVLGILLIAYEMVRMQVSGPWVADYAAGFILLIAALIFYTWKVSEGQAKWKIMAVYDGSMIAWFLIVYFLHGYG